MQIYHLHTPPNIFGHPFFASGRELNDSKGLFAKFYTGNPVEEHWQPAMICGLHQVDIGKVLISAEEFWVINEKTKTLLEPLLKKSVEYLPTIPRQQSHKKISRVQLMTKKKIYQPILDTVHTEHQYLLNILDIKTKEIIDFEQSECQYDEETDVIALVKKLAFKPELIKDCHIFKIDNPGIEFRSTTFVSDAFKAIIEQYQLQGLTFSEPIWEDTPIPNETTSNESPKLTKEIVTSTNDYDWFEELG